MTSFGRIDEFSPAGGDWDTYAERLEYYFEANSIKDPGKKKAVLLSVAGADTFSLLKDLITPYSLKDKSYEELSQTLREHCNPKPSVIIERFNFYMSRQKPGQSFSDFIAHFKKITKHCEFGDALEDMLRDLIVVGITDEHTRRRLLSERKLTFANAQDIALAMESASKNASDIEACATAATHSISQKNVNQGGQPTQFWKSKPKQKSCFRCNGKHSPESCQFKEAVCNFCHKTGHISPACLTRKNVEKNRNTRTHNIQSEEAVNECESASIHRLFNLRQNDRIDPLMVLVGINGRNVEMEIDTGAAVSLISRAAFDNLWCEADKPTLQPMSQKLATYTGESITPCGRCQVSVEYNGQQYRLPLVVVPGAGPMLLGRNWLQVVQLSWKRIHQLKSVNATPAIENIIAKYPDVFKDELGTLKGFTAKLSVDPRTKPIFCKARHVPFALREKVDKELDRLVSQGIIEPIQYSEWAAPIVAVVKTDQSIRLCGDYKMTINKCSNLDQYPIPRIDDLYARLVGGQKFTKLDLRSAFLQVPLEENSKKYLTINTQRGLYRFNRLSFGVKSAPGIYQRCMDNLFANEPHVVCYQDDILITGSTDSEHLTNLDRVLKKLSESGLRIRLDKCKFMASSVTYLGHWIDSEGLHPTEEKIRAIRDAPAPRNETELKAFLGLFQFYARYVPNVADKLGPLYYLLRKGVSWKWGATQSTAFQRAKDSLQSAKVLVHYDPEKELVLTCDASQYGVGAILSHVLLDGSEKPVAFASRSLSPAEKNYSQLDKEGLSIIFGVKNSTNISSGVHSVSSRITNPLSASLVQPSQHWTPYHQESYGGHF